MDLALFFRVLWRHKTIVTVGLILAVALAALSYVSPSYEDGKVKLSYREDEQWQSQARVLLTIPGFSPGKSLVQDNKRAESIQRAEQRLTGLALLYAGLATGDGITRIVRDEGSFRGKIVAAAAIVSGGSATLPIVEITAVAPSGPGARDLANRYANALGVYVTREQEANGVALSERVSMLPLNKAERTELATPRGKTLPIIVFLAILSATVGLALVLENLGRRAPSIEVEPTVLGVEPPVAGIEPRSDPRHVRTSSR